MFPDPDTDTALFELHERARQAARERPARSPRRTPESHPIYARQALGGALLRLGAMALRDDGVLRSLAREHRARKPGAEVINTWRGSRGRFDKMRRLARAPAVAGLAAAAALMFAACGGASPGDPSSPLGVIDQATRTVQLNLIITESNFNGYPGGEMTMRVPQGWRVDVYCSNQASTPQSCAIVPRAGSTTPAFSGASSPDPAAGLPSGRAWNFSFLVGAVGSYRLVSLSPGHRDNMWSRFDVVATGEPSVSISGARPPNSGAERQASRNS